MKQQRNRVRYTVEALVLFLLAIAVAMPWGCSKSPMSPELNTVGNTFELPNGMVAHPGTKLPETKEASPDDGSGVPMRAEEISQHIEEMGDFEADLDKSGGYIPMDIDGEESYFVVPDNALAKSEHITVTVYRDLSAVDRRATEFHFGPKGLVFERPAQLSYHSLLKDGEHLTLLWWDPDKEGWVESASTIVVGGYATFPITHFSDFRVTERISLGGQAKAH
jgi:hypothetical protein